MMSEKRFICGMGFSKDSDNPIRIIHDKIDDKDYYLFADLCKIMNEQQATIRKLQDLCGESDGENAKLRIKNKRLQKELNDCEKFRYTVFKRLNDEIKLLKPTNIEQYEQIQKLQEENEQLRAKLREKEEDERLYANEIVKLNKEAKEVLDFKSLGGDY